jgi:hypothetical protein
MHALIGSVSARVYRCLNLPLSCSNIKQRDFVAREGSKCSWVS